LSRGKILDAKRKVQYKHGNIKKTEGGKLKAIHPRGIERGKRETTGAPVKTQGHGGISGSKKEKKVRKKEAAKNREKQRQSRKKGRRNYHWVSIHPHIRFYRKTRKTG